MSAAPQPLSAALPARRATRLSPPARLRAGAALQTASGSVSAFFSMESFDHRRGVATYMLRVINRTKSALVCRTWVLCNNGEAVLAYPSLFEVEPFSSSETLVPVWPSDFSPFDRAVAEVVGNGVHCVVEAAAPPIRKRVRGLGAIVAASLISGVLAFAAAAGLRGALPHIAALALPPEALAGTTVQAEYAAFGAGNLSYVVLAPDGRRLQGGRLGDRSGSVFIPIPSSSGPGAYTVRMAMEGPLGSVSETRVLNTIAAKPENAWINDISVEPTVAKPGHAIKVTYSAGGNGGYVRLVGIDGTIWAQQPFSSNGETALVVPPVPGSREMRVLLHVTQGSSTAQSMAGIVVAGPIAEAVPGDAQIPGDDRSGAGTDANGTFQIVQPTVRSGGPISVRVISPHNGMRIALTDAQSHEISAVDVGAEADVVTLRAPSVSVPTRYTVVASFTDGFGQESVVEPVTVLP